MARHMRFTHAVLLGALPACACGGDRIADPPPNADDKTTFWRIDTASACSCESHCR